RRLDPMAFHVGGDIRLKEDDPAPQPVVSQQPPAGEAANGVGRKPHAGRGPSEIMPRLSRPQSCTRCVPPTAPPSPEYPIRRSIITNWTISSLTVKVKSVSFINHAAAPEAEASEGHRGGDCSPGPGASAAGRVAEPTARRRGRSGDRRRDDGDRPAG